LAAAARIVLRDWSIGKFDRYTTPPAPVINTATAQSESSITAKPADSCDNITQLYANDEAILSTIRTRKERRKQGGIVKFAYGSIDSRKVAVEEIWNGLEQNDDEESDDDDDEVDDGGMDVDGEDEDEENEDEEDEEEDEKESVAEAEESSEGEEDDDSEDADQDDEIELPRLSHKQKRKRGPERSMPSPPAKKVSFGVMPPASTRGSKFDRQKIGRLTTKGKDNLKLKEKSRSKSNPTTATSTNPVHKTSEKKGKIANVTAKIKAKGSPALAQQSKDKSDPEVYDFGKFF
jgi:nuclear GTP-binding protein